MPKMPLKFWAKKEPKQTEVARHPVRHASQGKQRNPPQQYDLRVGPQYQQIQISPSDGDILYPPLDYRQPYGSQDIDRNYQIPVNHGQQNVPRGFDNQPVQVGSSQPRSRQEAQRQRGYQNNVQQAQWKSKAVAERIALVEAEKAASERHRKSSKESVRQLRELIRLKYRLDQAIWNEREVLEADQHLVIKDCERADKVLKRIYEIVEAWNQDTFTIDEWKVAKKIKVGILDEHETKHVKWAKTPPWTIEVNDEVIDEDDEWWDE